MQAANAYTPKLAADKDVQRRAVNSFFLNSLNVSSSPRWAGCSKPPLQVRMFGVVRDGTYEPDDVLNACVLLMPCSATHARVSSNWVSCTAHRCTPMSRAAWHWFIPRVSFLCYARTLWRAARRCTTHLAQHLGSWRSLSRNASGEACSINGKCFGQVHYLFGSTFRQQMRSLERYAKDGYYPHTRVDVIISVMVRAL